MIAFGGKQPEPAKNNPEEYSMGFVYGWKNVDLTPDGDIKASIAANNHWRYRTASNGSTLDSFRWDTEPKEAHCVNTEQRVVLQAYNTLLRSGTKDQPIDIKISGEGGQIYYAGDTTCDPDMPPFEHKVPDWDCTCGFYAWYSVVDAIEHDLGVARIHPIIRVKAWGKIIEASRGFRAQFMQLDALVLPDHAPYTKRTWSDRLARKFVNATIARGDPVRFDGLWNEAHAAAVIKWADRIPIYFSGAPRLLGIDHFAQLKEYFGVWDSKMVDQRVVIPSAEIPTEDLTKYSGTDDTPKKEG